jgi:hypothetical protein
MGREPVSGFGQFFLRVVFLVWQIAESPQFVATK